LAFGPELREGRGMKKMPDAANGGAGRRSTRTTEPPPSRAGKRLVSAFVEPEVLRAFKILVAQNDSTIQQTLVTLINEYFERNGKPPLAR
jgi:Antitoxin-like ribbon-helix-helix